MNRKNILSVLGILILGLALRMVYFADLHGTYLLSPVGDAKCYLDWATQIATQDFWGQGVFFQAPLYSYAMGAFFRVFGVHPEAWIAVQYVLSLLSGLFLYLLGRRFFDRPTAVLAATLAVAYPVLIYFDHLLLKTSLTVFLTCGFLLLTEMAADTESSWLRSAVAGWVGGLAALNNESFLAVLPLALAYLLYKKHRQGRIWKSSLIHGGAFVISAILIVSPVAVRNFVKSGDFVLITNQGGINFWIGNNPAADGTERRPLELALRPSCQFEAREFQTRAEEASGRSLKPSEVSVFWYDQAFLFIAQHPGRFLELTGKKLALLATSVEIPDNYNFQAYGERGRVLKFLPFGFGILFASAIAGLFLARRRLGPSFFLLAFTGVQALLLALYHVNSRYRMILFPALILFAAQGWVGLSHAVRRGRWREAAMALLLAGLAFAFTRLPLYRIDTSLDTYQEAVFEIGQGRRDRAEILLLESVKRNDQNPMAWAALGTIDLERGHPAAALERLNRAYEINPYLVGTLNNRGSALAELGNAGEAEKMFRKALRYDSHSATALYNLALLRAREGRYTEALTFLSRVSEPDARVLELKAKLLRAEKAP